LLEIVYNRQTPSISFSKSIFLAGPTPRNKNVKSWREEAIEILKNLNYDGIIFSPEDNPDNPEICFPDYETDPEGYKEQVKWEQKWLSSCDCILFWIPRELSTLPGFTTNVEFGIYYKSGKISIGAPKDSAKNNYLKVTSEAEGLIWYEDLKECIINALTIIGDGSYRSYDDRYVPLNVWKHKTFQNWKQQLITNELNCSVNELKTEYVFIPKMGNKVFFYLMKADIKIGKENRNKDNEFIIGRPDLCTLVVHTKTENYKNMKFLLVKEFRSPVRNTSGYVYEFPSGSVCDNKNDVSQALEELVEETGVKLSIDSNIKFIRDRQCLSTFSTHNNIVYSIEIPEGKMNEIEVNTNNKFFGLEKDTERTYVEIWTLDRILKENLMDWSMLGILLEIIYKNI
jgi:ADP-ribose pyrophosphatase YjhB (NUDIX family)